MTAQSTGKKSHASRAGACVRRNCRQAACSAAARAESAAVSAPPHRRGAHPDSQAEQLALDPLVTPARILPCHPLDQRSNPPIHGRSAAGVRVGPSPADKPPVPAQQRVRRDQPGHPQWTGEQPGQGSQYRPVGPVRLWLGVLPPQHRNLLAEHQQLGVLRRRRARQQHHPAGQADEYQVEHRYGHKPAMLPATRPLPQANQQASHLSLVLEPTGASQGRFPRAVAVGHGAAVDRARVATWQCGNCPDSPSPRLLTSEHDRLREGEQSERRAASVLCCGGRRRHASSRR